MRFTFFMPRFKSIQFYEQINNKTQEKVKNFCEFCFLLNSLELEAFENSQISMVLSFNLKEKEQ